MGLDNPILAKRYSGQHLKLLTFSNKQSLTSFNSCLEVTEITMGTL